MADTWKVESERRAVEGPADQYTIRNLGPDTLYYGGPSVSSSDTQLAAGAQVTVAPTTWLISAGQSRVTVAAVPVSPSSEGGSARYLSDLGVVGDGVVDDTAALNAALLLSASQNVKVIGRPGATYRVTQVGTKNFVNPAGGTIVKGYGVEIPAGAKVDGRGAKLQVAAGVDFIALSNKRTSVAGDVIDCQHLVVDGGGRADRVRTTPLTWFWGLDKSRIIDVTVQNCSYVGAQFAASTDCYCDELYAHAIDGQAWILGGNTSDQIARCRFGLVKSWDVASLGTFSLQGNSVVIGAVKCSFAALIGRNCGGGNKITDYSADVHVDYSEFDGAVLAGEADNGTANSGTKVQGTDAASKSDRITFGVVSSRNGNGAGFYTNFAGTVKVGKYVGYRNARNGTAYELDLNNFDHVSFDDCESRLTGKTCVQLAPSGAMTGRSQFGRLAIIDPGDVTTASVDGIALGTDGTCMVDQLEIMDTRGTPINFRAINGISAMNFWAANYRTNIGNALDIRSARMFVGNMIYGNGTTPTTGEVTLTAGTSTTISNQNVRSQTVTGGFVEPIVDLIPMNAAALTLGRPRYTAVNNTLTLLHPTAAGTEKFAFRIVGYTFRAAQFA